MPSAWRIVSAELVQRGRTDLSSGLRAAVRREGAVALAETKAAWLTVDVTSTKGGIVPPDKSTGLRLRVSGATRIQTTMTGVRITVAPGKVDPRYGRTLPWYLNGSGRPWRHPVFGRSANPQDWTVQRGQEVFFSTIGGHAPAFRAGIERAMEDVARRF